MPSFAQDFLTAQEGDVRFVFSAKTKCFMRMHFGGARMKQYRCTGLMPHCATYFWPSFDIRAIRHKVGGAGAINVATDAISVGKFVDEELNMVARYQNYEPTHPYTKRVLEALEKCHCDVMSTQKAIGMTSFKLATAIDVVAYDREDQCLRFFEIKTGAENIRDLHVGNMLGLFSAFPSSIRMHYMVQLGMQYAILRSRYGGNIHLEQFCIVWADMYSTQLMPLDARIAGLCWRHVENLSSITDSCGSD